MEESTYRQMVDDIFKVIDAAFEDVDPDVAESMISQGTLTITFADGRRCILSPQAPVRQMWVAFKDRAWHFDREPAGGRWIDDRGQGIELFSLIESVTEDASGVKVQIAR